MNDIAVLTPKESVHLDPDRFEALYLALGPGSADEVLCRAVEELAIRIGQCEQLWRGEEWDQLRKQTRSLIAISNQIGMTKLSHVARDVTSTIDADDAVAISATLTRLLRVAERSLTAVWDLQDMSI